VVSKVARRLSRIPPEPQAQVGSTRVLARAPLPACGSLLTPEPLRDPDCRQLSRADLLPSCNTPQPIQRLCVECDRESLGGRTWQTDLNGLPFVKEPREILVGEFVPFLGFLSKSPPLCCC
jgi:hypothetical protein